MKKDDDFIARPKSSRSATDFEEIAEEKKKIKIAKALQNLERIHSSIPRRSPTPSLSPLHTPRSQTPNVDSARTLTFKNDFSAKKQSETPSKSPKRSLSPEIEEPKPKVLSLKEQISQMINALDTNQLTPYKDDPILSKEDIFDNSKSRIRKTESFDKENPKEENSFKVLDNSAKASEDKKIKGKYYVLKRNHEALIEVLKEQEDKNLKNQSKIDDLEHEIEELKTFYELQIDDLKLENNALKQRLRNMQVGDDFTPVFDSYENELQKYEKQMIAMRSETIELIKKIEKSDNNIENDEVEESAILARKRKKVEKELRDSIKKLEIQLKDKENENFAFRKKERQWNMSRKCLENISKKTGKLQNVVGKQTKSLQSNEKTFQEMIDEIERLSKENDSLKKELNEVTEDNIKIVEEMMLMRDLATTAGMPQQTIDKINKNLKTEPNHDGRFAMSLIVRLKNEILALYNDTRLNQLTDNIKREVESVYNSFEQIKVREENLLAILMDLQEKLEKDQKFLSKESNRALRENLISMLTN